MRRRVSPTKPSLFSMEPLAAAKKILVSVTVPPGPVRAPCQRPLAPSVALVTSVANDKSDNEMFLGAMYRYQGKPQKTSARRLVDE